MKKVLLTLTAIAGIAFASQAQTQAGKFAIGGGLGFNSSKIKDSDAKSSSFNIKPQASYFIDNNIAIGAALGYEWSESNGNVTGKSTNDAFSVSPFVRAYQGNGPVKFFGQLSVPMSWGNQKLEGNKVGTTESYGVAIAPGLAYFPTEKIGIELSVRGLYFESTTNKSEITSGKFTTNDFGLNANSLAPTLGVQFHF